MIIIVQLAGGVGQVLTTCTTTIRAVSEWRQQWAAVAHPVCKGVHRMGNTCPWCTRLCVRDGQQL